MDGVDVEHLLYELCVSFGLCLPPEEAQSLVAAPPTDVDSFTDAVLAAEGMDPLLADKPLRQQVRERIARAFRD